jgi:hypothetical protein
MTMATLRETSKQEFSGKSSLENINAGSLQRIADATEKMASSYVDLEADRNRYREWYQKRKAEAESLTRQNSALRGVITRLNMAAEKKAAIA